MTIFSIGSLSNLVVYGGGSFQAPKGPIAFLVFFFVLFCFLETAPLDIWGNKGNPKQQQTREREREREKQPPTDRLGGTEIKLTIDHPKRKWIEWM